jgi:hypothetical protein
VVLYVFAGRRENMELQMPFIHRALDENPWLTVDIWNLTKLYRDAEYVRGIKTSPRLRVRNDYYHVKPWWKRFDCVWREYTKPQYQDTHFVKVDDDVVFWEADAFGQFVESSMLTPGVISSALTINNGASVAHTPGMQARFNTLDIPLLDVHESGEFARLSHTYFLTHWQQLLGLPVEAKPIEDWLSINMISYGWGTGVQVATQLGKPSPSVLCGRPFRPDAVIGDEGACNTVRRQVIQGFLAAHLTFGPQELPKEEWAMFRKEYAELGRRYLARA